MTFLHRPLALGLGFLSLLAGIARGSSLSLELMPEPAITKGKHVVLVSGDEEYRSEEALPMRTETCTFGEGGLQSTNPGQNESIEGMSFAEIAQTIAPALAREG